MVWLGLEFNSVTMMITIPQPKLDGRTPSNVPTITVNGTPLERVSPFNRLGVTINNKLTCGDHVEKIYKKPSQRLHFISQLRHTKMSPDELMKVYVSLHPS